MMSGLVLVENVKWISFQGSYDFAYLLKTLTCCDLPAEEQEFFELLYTFFPSTYDVKFMMTAVDGMHGGLAALGDTLQVKRIGPMHQAGSDSLLTAQTYFALIKKHLGPTYEHSKFCGQLNGLGDNHTRRKNVPPMHSMNSADSMFTSAAIQVQMTNGVYFPPSAQHYVNFGVAAGMSDS